MKNRFFSDKKSGKNTTLWSCMFNWEYQGAAPDGVFERCEIGGWILGELAPNILEIEMIREQKLWEIGNYTEA